MRFRKMITYGFQYDVKPDKREEFLKISNDALKAMESMKGHIMTKLFEDVNSPNSFMIYSEWESNDDFKVFMNSPEFKNVQNASRDMLTGRPKHKMYETKPMS
jgi:quinol monooxygenase YgiN